MVHRLSVKVAVLSSFGTAALFMLAHALVPSPGLALLAVLILSAGIAAYTAVYLLVAGRLQALRQNLGHIRAHRFGEMAPGRTSGRDEADEAVWDAYSTGLAVEKEIKDLERMESFRREFVGNVSHELKTPIFAVQGFAETLLDGAVEEESVRHAFVEKILRNATRLSKLASDLAEISRIETGETKIHSSPFRLERLVQEVVEAVEVQAEEKQVALSWKIADALPPVLADREAIRHVLVNLVDNAVKYTNPGGHAEIRAQQVRESEVRIAVVDDGVGVAPVDLPRLTERFYRVDKSRSREEGGTGLGLSIAKHLLGMHGSELEIESTPGRGSSFAFTLPRAPAPRQPKPTNPG